MWSDGCENRPPVSTTVHGGGRKNRDFAKWVFLVFPVFVYFSVVVVDLRMVDGEKGKGEL